jgi:glycosyltransferase involved in cell wall biosynthesis
MNSTVTHAKPRIAMLIPTIEKIGGAERQLLLLAKELSVRGWQVTIVALSGATAEELAETEVAFLSLEMRKAWTDPRGWFRYLAWAAENKPGIVHAHLPHAIWFARCVRLLAPIRVQLDTLHTSNPGTRARRLVYRLTSQLTNCVTSVSAAVAGAAFAAGIARRENLAILFNGVTIPSNPSRRSPRIPSQFQWLAVGRLVPVKDYPILLRAFAILPGRPTLQIAGEGPDEQPLRKLAAELKIEDRVQFAGFHRDIKPLLSAADGFVLSSLWEGLPMSVLEASAASLPVVATDGPGTRETIQPGVTGLIVPVSDPTALAQAMADVMAMQPDRRKQMGLSGRQFVEAHFSLPNIVGQWEQLYSRLLAEHPRASRHG